MSQPIQVRQHIQVRLLFVAAVVVSMIAILSLTTTFVVKEGTNNYGGGMDWMATLPQQLVLRQVEEVSSTNDGDNAAVTTKKDSNDRTLFTSSSSSSTRPADTFTATNQAIETTSTISSWPVNVSLANTTTTNTTVNTTLRYVPDKDYSYLLDVAVIGHSKSGTSSILNWFQNHPEIFIKHREERIVVNGPANAVVQLKRKGYSIFRDQGLKIAYKRPGDITHPYRLAVLHDHFPHTKLMIGIRHPVLWFESFFNFWQTIANGGNRPYLPRNTTQLIGPCILNEHVCTDHARFHLHIANAVHATDMTTKRERQLLLGNKIPSGVGTIHNNNNNNNATEDPDRHTTITDRNVTNPAFIFEIAQLSDSIETRNNVFREEMQHFLELQQAFPPAPRVAPESKLRQVRRRGRKAKAKVNAYKIHICDPQHEEVRRVLMEHSRNIAVWVREYLLPAVKQQDGSGNGSIRVAIASHDHMYDLMESYLIDPCDGGNATNATVGDSRSDK